MDTISRDDGDSGGGCYILHSFLLWCFLLHLSTASGFGTLVGGSPARGAAGQIHLTSKQSRTHRTTCAGFVADAAAPPCTHSACVHVAAVGHPSSARGASPRAHPDKPRQECKGQGPSAWKDLRIAKEQHKWLVASKEQVLNSFLGHPHHLLFIYSKPEVIGMPAHSIPHGESNKVEEQPQP